MGLIDADALMVQLANMHAHSWGKVERAIGEVAEMLNNAPTIDAEPVRHGRWGYRAYRNDAKITVSGEVVCSNCHAPYFRVRGMWFKHCPHCGAKMDGGAEDENA